MRWTKIFIDLDGTMAGENEWTGFYHNTKKLFTDLVWKPEFDLFSILTSRPKMDRPIISLVCRKWGFDPAEIFTSTTMFYKFKNKEDVAQWKFNFLQKELSLPLMKQVVYIDNDPEIIGNFPQTKGLICCNVKGWQKMREELYAEH